MRKGRPAVEMSVLLAGLAALGVSIWLSAQLFQTQPIPAEPSGALLVYEQRLNAAAEGFVADGLRLGFLASDEWAALMALEPPAQYSRTHSHFRRAYSHVRTLVDEQDTFLRYTRSRAAVDELALGFYAAGYTDIARLLTNTQQ